MKCISPGICLLAASIPAVLTLAGCGSKQEQNAIATEVMKQTYKIDPTGTLRIRHLSGSVSIRGADITELQFEAVKKATNAAQLANLKVSVVAQDDTVTITTSSLREKNKARSLGSGTVDYTLVVPRTIRLTLVDLEDGDVLVDGLLGQDLRINLVDGKLKLRNCCTNVNATIANGGIDFAYPECDRKPFSAVAQLMHGDAIVLIPRQASLRVEAETGHGKIVNEFAETVELNGQCSRRVEIVRGREAPSEVKLQVVTGDIRIGENKTAVVDSSVSQRLDPESKNVSSGH
jgi:DUF4097 and DUF4098 domain-containing protein YvlB